ncbi:MAG: ATP-dependent DNA helicase DinG [Oceanospirillaceae bacterium]|nr:ATP-dependent DNA helicase DinG [Oceanospirillaceae bacterium]
MLTNTLKKSIQSSYRQFLDHRNLKPRSGQKQMIAHVARVLGGIESDHNNERKNDNHLCVIEAGTGTGKTMAYLLSAVPIARAKECKLVLSTATVALQEQLINKDLPELNAITDWSCNYILAKGRGRYFCLLQAKRFLDSQDDMGQMALYEDEQAFKIDEHTVAYYRTLLADFNAGTWDGDRDSMKNEIAEEVWRPLTSDHTRCTNRHCDYFNNCPFYQARDALDKADIIVANHDLVLADLSLGGGAILPEPANTIYVFDEAHHLGQKTTGHFAYNLRLKSTIKWLKTSVRQLDQLIAETNQHPSIVQYIDRMEMPRRDLESALEQWLQQARNLFTTANTDRDRMRFANGLVPESLMVQAATVAAAAEKWSMKAEQIVDVLKEALDGSVVELDKSVAERWYPVLGVIWSRGQSMYWLAKSYASLDDPGTTPTARWINVLDTVDGTDFECRSCPVSAADTLKEHLWDNCFGAVLTSATMTALGRFDRTVADLGLPSDTLCAQLPSPFDYQNSASLIVPAMKVDPSKPEEHTQEVISFLNENLPQATATLVLFSSWRQMGTVIDSMSSALKEKIMAQGELSKNEILRRHRKKIDDGLSSVIFGLASFSEGVDLPGDYLKQVIITKLPFGVPDDPVDATMSEWIENSGGNAFMQLTVPATSMRLTQAVGRLLRSESDTGEVILLDRRVVTRRYGRQLLDALPPFRRQIER